ncbi:MAG TPA: condensation domain-containing protein, partial [Trebonia sp.]|nr:condensation domain-containing protein [Trebonia sp.]
MEVSFGQQRMWFVNRLEDAGAAYTMAMAVRLRGPLDRAALQTAWADVVRRHEALRTRFTADEDSVVSAEVVSADEDAALLREYTGPATLLANASFDLAAEPPVRAGLFDVAEDEYVLLVVVHHIAVDGPSLRVLARDFSQAYRCRLRGVDPADCWDVTPLSQAELVRRERALLASGGGEEQLSFWRETLAGLPEQLDLPYDRPRPRTPAPLGGRVPVALGAGEHAALRRVAAQHGVSPATAARAAFAALLSRLGAGTDIPLGAPVDGRSGPRLDATVGFLANTLVLRMDLSGDPSYTELLARAGATEAAALAHQDLPFEYLVARLNPGRSLARHPLFQVLVVMEDAPDSAWDLPGLTATAERIGSTGDGDSDSDSDGDGEESFGLFDLYLNLTEGWLWYNSALFDRQTAKGIAARLTRVLAAWTEDPSMRLSALDVLLERERVGLGVVSGLESGAASVLDVLSRQPDRAALVCGERVVGYRE